MFWQGTETQSGAGGAAQAASAAHGPVHTCNSLTHDCGLQWTFEQECELNRTRAEATDTAVKCCMCRNAGPLLATHPHQSTTPKSAASVLEATVQCRQCHVAVHCGSVTRWSSAVTCDVMQTATAWPYLRIPAIGCASAAASSPAPVWFARHCIIARPFDTEMRAVPESRRRAEAA